MTESKLITFGYHDFDVGHPNNHNNYRICGSRTRQSASNPYCHRPAGWGTSHPGVGRCKLHGGCSYAGPDHPNWRGGRYAYKFRGRLKQHFEGMQVNDPNPLDLLPELEVQRVILTLALEALNEKSAGSLHNKMMLDKDKTVVGGGGGINQLNMVPVDSLPAEFLFNDDEIRLVSELVKDVVATVTKIKVMHNKRSLTKTEASWLISKIKQGLEKFVPQENRGAFIEWLKKEVPYDDERDSS